MISFGHLFIFFPAGIICHWLFFFCSIHLFSLPFLGLRIKGGPSFFVKRNFLFGKDGDLLYFQSPILVIEGVWTMGGVRAQKRFFLPLFFFPKRPPNKWGFILKKGFFPRSARSLWFSRSLICV